MGLPETVTTKRLVLRRPRPPDAEALYARYAADPDVTRYLTWAPHRDLRDTRAYIERSEFGWSTASDHAYLAWMENTLVGGTGLTPVAPGTLRTGYVVARDSWRQGIATEMLDAMVKVAFSQPKVYCVEALVEPGHEASVGVLRKCGFRTDRSGPVMGIHPNLGPGARPLERFMLLRQN